MLPELQAFLSVSETAAWLRVSAVTLGRWRIEGCGPRFRKFGRRVVYAHADLVAWAEAQSRISTSTLDPRTQSNKGDVVEDDAACPSCGNQTPKDKSDPSRPQSTTPSTKKGDETSNHTDCQTANATRQRSDQFYRKWGWRGE
jgi:hypothetical protein